MVQERIQVRQTAVDRDVTLLVDLPFFFAKGFLLNVLHDGYFRGFHVLNRDLLSHLDSTTSLCDLVQPSETFAQLMIVAVALDELACRRFDFNHVGCLDFQLYLDALGTSEELLIVLDVLCEKVWPL